MGLETIGTDRLLGDLSAGIAPVPRGQELDSAIAPLLPLPSGRTLAQLRHHYTVEKSIAVRLKAASREGRKLIYRTMYDELFREVPDHPRLTQRADPDSTAIANAEKLGMVRSLLTKSTLFVEIAPGDCMFARELAPSVREAIGIDISDQRDHAISFPDNCRLVIYDGYDTREVPDDSVDVAFSFQFIEHLHPEETKDHFLFVRRLLKPSGTYVFCTPHRLAGPYDISRYFSEEPQGFHLKEWSFTELKVLLESVGFSQVSAYWYAKQLRIRVPFTCFSLVERLLGSFPKRWTRHLAGVLLPKVIVMAAKK
jgi:SAM-dependent methyltransferase